MPDLAIGSALLAGLAAGLASAPHCVGMCGPLSAMACDRAGGTRTLPRYQLGRLLGYALLGALAGQLGEVFSGALGDRSRWWLPLLTAFSLLWVARRLWGVRGGRPASAMVKLGRPSVWTRVGRVLLGILPREATSLGALSALLPCGALYAAILLAAGTASPVPGAALMAGFSLTSGFALWLTGGVLRLSALTPGHRVARALSIGLVVVACVIAVRPLTRGAPPHTPSDPATAEPSCH